jgi:excisionase family DNA binding protein
MAIAHSALILVISMTVGRISPFHAKAMELEESKRPALFLRVSEAARLLSVSRSTCYEMVDRGLLPAVKLTEKSWRVPLQAVEKLAADAMRATNQGNE